MDGGPRQSKLGILLQVGVGVEVEVCELPPLEVGEEDGGDDVVVVVEYDDGDPLIYTHTKNKSNQKHPIRTCYWKTSDRKLRYVQGLPG